MLPLCTHPSQSQDLSRHATYRPLFGRGLLEAADLDGEGGKAMRKTTIQEEMTMLTTSDPVSPQPRTTINLSDKEKGGILDKEKGREWLLWTRIFEGGMVTLPTRRRSGHPRRRRRRRRSGWGWGRRSRRPLPAAAQECEGYGRHWLSGHHGCKDHDNGEDGDGDDDDPTERLWCFDGGVRVLSNLAGIWRVLAFLVEER